MCERVNMCPLRFKEVLIARETVPPYCLCSEYLAQSDVGSSGEHIVLEKEKPNSKYT